MKNKHLKGLERKLKKQIKKNKKEGGPSDALKRRKRRPRYKKKYF